MPMGPGKYDRECDEARDKTSADAVLMVVVGGDRGSGFSATFAGLRGVEVMAHLPGILRDTARQIEESAAGA